MGFERLRAERDAAVDDTDALADGIRESLHDTAWANCPDTNASERI